MRTVKGLRAVGAIGILVGVTLVAAASSAQAEGFTVNVPGSVNIFPKVIVQNPSTDTTIQLTNTGNSMAHVKCFYVDGVNWRVTDFELWLTRQQPTSWSVANGRPVNAADNNVGLDPGAVPPKGPPFTGFLVCVQVDASGTPIGTNSLKGEATVGRVEGPGADNLNFVSKYNAIAIQACGEGGCGGTGTLIDNDNVLKLDNMEYAACPAGAHMNFAAQNTQSPIIDAVGDGPSIVRSSLSLVPCDMDFENLIPGSALVTAQIRNELEQSRSIAPINIDCWLGADLNNLVPGANWDLPFIGTPFATALLDPQTDIGIVGVHTTLRVGGTTGAWDTATTNLYFAGNSPGQNLPGSEIRLPDRN